MQQVCELSAVYAVCNQIRLKLMLQLTVAFSILMEGVLAECTEWASKKGRSHLTVAAQPYSKLRFGNVLLKHFRRSYNARMVVTPDSGPEQAIPLHKVEAGNCRTR